MKPIFPILKSYSREYQKLAELTANLIGSKAPNAEDEWVPPFKLESPTPHASHTEFEADMAVSSETLRSIRSILKQYNTEDSHRRSAFNRLLKDIDEKARTTDLYTFGKPPYGVAEVVNRHVGITSSAMVCLVTIKSFLQDHVSALAEQRRIFRNGAHKPADLHARAIAYRLARFYAFETGQRPETKTRSLADGASISYARAVGELFETLGIRTGVRSPMEWAIANIQDEDLLSLEEIIVSANSGELAVQIERQDDQLREMLTSLYD